jgi:inner membrane protein
MAVAAELPDIDTLWGLRGPVEGFAHHRGITHTFLGLPFEAAIVVVAVYGLHRWRVSRAAKVPDVPNRVRRPLTKAPVRWGFLYGCVLIALLSHLLLDYTNNYGLRPFFPFNPHWYAASITFIFDPLMFVLLLVPMVVPPLLGMVSAEVGAKRNPFRGQGLAVAALMCVVALWGLRFVEHRAAEQLALQQTYDVQEQPTEVPASPSVTVSEGTPVAEGAAAPTTAAPETELVQPPGQMLRVQRVSASPDPLNPFHWAVAMDFGQLYQLADVDTLAADVTPSDLTYPKLGANAMTRAAQGSPLGRVYLDWSSMPILTEEQSAPTSVARTRPTQKLTFRDPRFMGDVTWLRTTGSAPLTGVVLVDDNGQVVRQTMDGRREPAGHTAVREVNWDPELVALWVRVTSSSSKPGVKKPTRTEVAASKPVASKAADVSTSPIVSAPVPAPVNTTTPVPAAVQPVTTEPVKPVAVGGSTVVPPSGPPIADVVKTPPAPVIAPPTTPAPTVVKAVPPQPSAAPKPAVTVPKEAVVAKTVPTKSGPGVFERGEMKVSGEYQRFRNWIRWLTNTK